jgi:hypothetical protein
MHCTCRLAEIIVPLKKMILPRDLPQLESSRNFLKWHRNAGTGTEGLVFMILIKFTSTSRGLSRISGTWWNSLGPDSFSNGVVIELSLQKKNQVV